MAPEGGEALYVLVHTPHLRPGQRLRIEAVDNEGLEGIDDVQEVYTTAVMES